MGFKPSNRIILQNIKPGTYGGPLSVPVLTVNENGQMTGISSESIQEIYSGAAAMGLDLVRRKMMWWNDGRAILDQNGHQMMLQGD